MILTILCVIIKKHTYIYIHMHTYINIHMHCMHNYAYQINIIKNRYVHILLITKMNGTSFAASSRSEVWDGVIAPPSPRAAAWAPAGHGASAAGCLVARWRFERKHVGLSIATVVPSDHPRRSVLIVGNSPAIEEWET